MINEILKEGPDSIIFWRATTYMLGALLILLYPHLEAYRQSFKDKEVKIKQLEDIIVANSELLNKVHQLLENTSHDSIIIDGKFVKLKQLRSMLGGKLITRDSVIDSYGDD